MAAFASGPVLRSSLCGSLLDSARKDVEPLFTDWRSGGRSAVVQLQASRRSDCARREAAGGAQAMTKLTGVTNFLTAAMVVSLVLQFSVILTR